MVGDDVRGSSGNGDGGGEHDDVIGDGSGDGSDDVLWGTLLI